MNSVYLIFSTYEDAYNRERQVFADMNVTDPNTIAYADLWMHPSMDGRTALIVEVGYEQYFTSAELASATELSEDWF